jgi:hypothetical protein
MRPNCGGGLDKRLPDAPSHGWSMVSHRGECARLDVTGAHSERQTMCYPLRDRCYRCTTRFA